MLHARALVAGRAYTDIGFIHSPFTTLIAPVAQPPALPGLIAMVFGTIGESLVAVRALLVLSLALFAIAVWQYWRRREREAVAVLVTAWSVIALFRLHVVDTVLADLPFAAALWVTFAIADSPKIRFRARHYVALALTGALAFSFRMAALPLLPAIFCFVLLRPPAERRGLLAAGAVWTLTALGVLFLLPGADALGSEVPRSLTDMLRDAAVNVRVIFDGVRDWVPLTLPWRSANILLGGLLLLITALGAVVAFIERPSRFAYLAAAWYLVMLIVIPTRAARYMWPLYPLLSFAFIRGVQSLASRLTLGANAATVATGVGVTTLASGLLQDVASSPPRTLRREPAALEIVDSLRSIARRENVKAVFFSPRVLTWETGITATAFGGGSPGALFDEVHRSGLTYVAVGDADTHAPGTTETAQMVAAHAAAFELVVANGSFVLYRLRSQR